MTTYLITIADDNGWLDGCPDYWGVFFGEFYPAKLAFRRKKDAERQARELRSTFDDDGMGKPSYGIVAIDDIAQLDAHDVTMETGWRAFGEDDLDEIREHLLACKEARDDH